MIVMSRISKLLILAVICIAACLHAGEEVSERAAKLIPELGGKSWKGREKAQEQLLRLFVSDGASVAAAVADGVLSSKDPEIKTRLDALLPRMAPEYVRLGNRGFLGVNLGKVKGPVKVGDKTYAPIDMVTVLQNTSAREAGFVGGERILRIDDFDCTTEISVEKMVKYISSRGPKAEISIMYLLPDKTVKVKVVVLGERPPMQNDPALETVKTFMREEWMESVMRGAKKRKKQAEEQASNER